MVVIPQGRRSFGVALIIVTSLFINLASVVVVKGEGDAGICEVDTIQFTTTDALGPFYVEGSAMTSVIAPRRLLIDPADVFTVRGKLLGNNCMPLANARVEAWYAGAGLGGDGGGEYLDDGFRGQVFTDDCGNFQFTQTFPAVYRQRPIPHIHYRISSPEDDTQLLVTQLYFVGAIVAGYNPDSTKITRVINEMDGSRSCEFNIYVPVPGNADLDACKVSGEGNFLFADTTMLPSDIETMLPTEEEGTIIPSEDATDESFVVDIADEDTSGGASLATETGADEALGAESSISKTSPDLYD